MKKLLEQVLKFGAVGIIAFIIDYGTLIILTEVLNIHYLVSSFISFSTSTIFNFVASIKWVFDTNGKGSLKTFLTFIIFSVIGLGLNQVIMVLGVESVGVHYTITKIVATSIVMVFNFITRKLFLERKH